MQELAATHLTQTAAEAEWDGFDVKLPKDGETFALIEKLRECDVPILATPTAS